MGVPLGPVKKKLSSSVPPKAIELTNANVAGMKMEQQDDSCFRHVANNLKFTINLLIATACGSWESPTSRSPTNSSPTYGLSQTAWYAFTSAFTLFA